MFYKIFLIKFLKYTVPIFWFFISRFRITDKSEIVKLLQLFNDHWKDGRYRDFYAPVERYSVIQIDYFNTPPSDRIDYLKKLKFFP